MWSAQWELRHCSQVMCYDNNPLYPPILPSEMDLIQTLASALAHLLADRGTHSILLDLEHVLDSARKQLPETSDNTVLRHIYTDASIVWALAFTSKPDKNRSHIISAISQLDMAIIIAGAASHDKLDYVTGLIKKFQRMLPFSDTGSAQCSAESDNDVSAYGTPVGSSSASVPSIQPPSLGSFARVLTEAGPFILRGYANHWPACSNKKWSSKAYLSLIAGPGRVVPVEIGKDYRTETWRQEIMPFYRNDEKDPPGFLDFLEYPDAPKYVSPGVVSEVYLAQHNLFAQFPELYDDIVVPDYVYTCPDPPDDFPAYSPPGHLEGYVVNAWLGPASSMSPAHIDPFFNLYVQASGSKTVWLAPPDVSTHMYPCKKTKSSKTTPNEEATTDNTSAVDVFAARTAEFPEFWDKVVPRAISATLYPGDVLCFGPGWWHAMQSKTTSFSVSFWF